LLPTSANPGLWAVQVRRPALVNGSSTGPAFLVNTGLFYSGLAGPLGGNPITLES
jgi:hypothetical protein